MIVIRRMVDRQRAYTAIFLKGEPPNIFPTSDAEHARILQVYKQDRLHEGILNDFSEIDFPAPAASPATPSAPAPWPLAPSPRARSAMKKSPAPPARKKPVAPPAKKSPRCTPSAPAPLWLALTSSTASPARL
jgi:hypothetical protein